MTKKTQSKPTTTLSSLVNTLERFLSWLEVRNESWLRNKKFAFDTYKSYRKDKEWHAADADMWAAAIAYNEAMLVIEDLVTDLKFALERNPFPGEQKRLVAVAVELFPEETGVRFEPGRRRAFIKGDRLWRKVFEIGDINITEKIYFPEEDGEWDIIEIEEKLLLLVRADDTILAAEIPMALNLKANGKVYRLVKATLKERGWQWKQRKESGKIESIVIAPKEKGNRATTGLEVEVVTLDDS